MATFFKKSYFRFAFSLPIKSTLCYHFLSASLPLVAFYKMIINCDRIFTARSRKSARRQGEKPQLVCLTYLAVRLRQVLSFQKQNDRDISQVVFYFEYYQTAQIGADFVRARETEKPRVLTVCGRESLLSDRENTNSVLYVSHREDCDRFCRFKSKKATQCT